MPVPGGPKKVESTATPIRPNHEPVPTQPTDEGKAAPADTTAENAEAPATPVEPTSFASQHNPEVSLAKTDSKKD